MPVCLAPKPLLVTVCEASAYSSPRPPHVCSSFSGTLLPNTSHGSPFRVPLALTAEILSLEAHHSMNFILILPHAARWESNQPTNEKGIPLRVVQTFKDSSRGPSKTKSSHIFSHRLVSRSFGISRALRPVLDLSLPSHNDIPQTEEHSCSVSQAQDTVRPAPT